MPTKLEGAVRSERLAEIPKWQEVKGRDAIFRKFEFKDFKEAWSFMTKVAEEADKVLHFQSI
jgi:4a-hydroxytetrahydrobiopterin dehydratase